MPTIEWRQDAVSDLPAILDNISDDNADAAQALNESILRRIENLPSHPLAYRAGRVIATREMVVRPNYIVVYAENEETITILPILHAAQMWP